MLETIKEKEPDVTPWFIFGSEAWHLGHLIEFLPHGYIKSTLGAVDAKKAFLANDQDKLQFAAADGPMAVFGEDLVDLQNKGLINADVLTATNDNCVQDFASGKAAMFSNGMWALSSVLEANPDMADKIGFAPYPAYMPNSKPVVLSAEDSGYCISATTEHKEECIEFLNFLFSPENQKKYSEVAKAPSAFTDVDAEWAPENVVKEVNTLELVLLILMAKLEMPLRWTSLSLRPGTINFPLSIPLLLMERRNVNCISTHMDMTAFLSRQQAIGRNGIQAKLRFISVRVFNVWWFTAAMQMTDTSILTAFIFPNPLKGV